jgi:uncharacterized protein
MQATSKGTLLAAIVAALWLVASAAPTLHSQQKEKTVSHEQEFLAAVRQGDVAKVKEFLKTDRSLAGTKSAEGVSAILLALYHRKKEVVAALLATGVELNLFEASATGQEERVKALLEKQPNLVKTHSPDGFSPLGLAVFFGQKRVAETLLARGAPVNEASKNAMKVMPLHSAVAGQHTDIVRLLIDHGADVTACQTEDFTPLHQAAANGQVEVAELLLSRGAKVNAKTQKGKTPLDLATENKQSKMVDLLRKHGAS